MSTDRTTKGAREEWEALAGAPSDTSTGKPPRDWGDMAKKTAPTKGFGAGMHEDEPVMGADRILPDEARAKQLAGYNPLGITGGK